MRFKILSLFAAIQILSFGLWSGLTHAQILKPQSEAVVQVHPAPAKPSLPSKTAVVKEQESILSLNFSTRNMDEGKVFLNSIKTNQIETALKKLPQTHADSVKNIILDYSELAHRGLGGNSIIILRAVNMDTEEMIGVLVHELGHNVDYAALTSKSMAKKTVFKDGELPLYEGDPSVDFYRISWLSNTQQKKAAVSTDFVSGYAMSDPFEDFAECYVYYVLHNKDFKQLAAGSEAIYAKYRFMKYQVFGGEEFDTGDGLVQEDLRPWDITVLSYDLNEFLS
jgi:hypothetical protein